jgi:hypothetical protein
MKEEFNKDVENLKKIKLHFRKWKVLFKTNKNLIESL